MIPEDYRFWCNFYTEKLNQIAEGEMSIPIPSGSVNLPRSNTEEQEKIFTRSKFSKDGDRLNEEESGSLDTV